MSYGKFHNHTENKIKGTNRKSASLAPIPHRFYKMYFQDFKIRCSKKYPQFQKHHPSSRKRFGCISNEFIIRAKTDMDILSGRL